MNTWDPVAGRTDLITYTYNSRGQVTDSVIQSYDTGIPSFTNSYKEVYTYDANGYRVKKDVYTADPPNPEWKLVYKYNLYRNSQGALDSSDIIFEGKIDAKSYYTYGSSNKSTTTITYYYTNNSVDLVEKYYTSSDSANYITKDTSIDLVAPPNNPNASTTRFFFYKTRIYNTDHTQNELDEHEYVTTFGPIETYMKTVYTYSSCQTILPVTLLNFSGKMQSGKAILQWQTASEINASYYLIQRSIDGEHFTTAGNIKATGNIARTVNYSYTDTDAGRFASSKLYYRLAQVDADGKVSYSSIVSLTISKGAFSITVQPNPINNEVNICSRKLLPVPISPLQICKATLCTDRIVVFRQVATSTSMRRALQKEYMW